MEKVIALFMVMVLAGCSALPDVVYSYKKTDWNGLATVTQTVVCNADNTQIIAVNAAALSTSYFASDEDPLKISINRLDAKFADAEIAMSLTEDGRLKGINQSTTGQGESIIKSVSTLAATVAMLSAVDTAGSPSIATQCALINKWGAGKPVALLYRQSFNADNIVEPLEISPAAESSGLLNLLKFPLPTLKITKKNTESNIQKSNVDSKSKDYVMLALQEMQSLKVVVSDSEKKEINTFQISVPTKKSFELPIPKAKFFGKQAFVLGLSDAGSVTNISYGKGNGVAGAINSINTVAASQSDIAEVAELKAQADLIAQQQRLAACIAKPEQCK